MTELTRAGLGWSDHFASQTDAEAIHLNPPARIAEVHRDRVHALTPDDDLDLTLPPDLSAGDLAVGDWVLTDIERQRVHLRLTPKTELTRRAAGTDMRKQLIAANVDTLMIVSSCNADFNEARLERYLALATAAGTLPLVVLTKADMTDDPSSFQRRAERLSPLVTAVALDARDPFELKTLHPWLRPGETAALVGSSGVGKSTLSNGLTDGANVTQDIREDDAKGRHTTTARSLHRTTSGGWLIDTPGMRALRLNDVSDGIDQVFADIDDLAVQCRFSDCGHDTEPGCAVQSAITSGDLDPDRLRRWQKLKREDQHNSETIAEARARNKQFGKMVKTIMKDRR